MSSSTDQNISATDINANSATINSITSDSIVNHNTLTTDGITVGGTAAIGGNLVANGSATIHGALNAMGGISFGDVAFLQDGTDFTIRGSLSVRGPAVFSYDSIIGHDTFIRSSNGETVTEGIISAQNMRACNRLFVGDSPFEVNANSRTLQADTFQATFAKVVAAKAEVANGRFATLRCTEHAQLADADIATVNVTDTLTAHDIQAQSFTAIAEFLAKGLTVDGSAKIIGGVVISGANQKEAALCVDNLPAVFNHGIKVYHKSGVLAQTLTVFGTTNTTGTAEEETIADRYALITDIGVRSKFQGDVLVRDANVILDNSPLLAEKIVVAPVSTFVTNADTLEILRGGDGFDVQAENQITYDASDEDEDTVEVRTADTIRTRGETVYTGRMVDITSPQSTATRSAVRGLSTRKQLRAVNLSEMTKAFRIKQGPAKYRLDAGGNVLLKKAVIEKVQASKIAANEIVAHTFKTDTFQMTNVAVEGVMAAQEGVSIGDPAANTGTSEIYGEVYNYGNMVNKDASTVEFREQATQKFTNASALKVEEGASLIVDEGAYASLHGLVELDMANLVLFNSKTGKRYKLIMRDAEGAEGDDTGDIAVEFGEIVAEDPVVTTVAEDTRNRATLRADLEEFQARLKRI